MEYKKLLYIVTAIITSIVIAFLISMDNKVGIIVVASVCAIPFAILFLFISSKSPFWPYIALIIINYFALGIQRYIPSFPSGTIIDILFLVTLFSLLIFSIRHQVNWKLGINATSLLALIWMIYCLLSIVNPQIVSVAAWYSTVRGVGVYIFLTIFLTCLICTKFEQLKKFIIILGVLTILATIKALIQKYIGFDAAEKIWLYRDGGYLTHIIYTGIRYFSFFSDAAAFGAAMGQASVLFLTITLFEKKKGIKIFYIIVGLCALYSMAISGTRSAYVIPFIGFAVFIFLSKNLRSFSILSVALICAFIFFKFTTIGNSNKIIYRLRSVFSYSEDNSYIVRLKNQQILKEYLSDKPFGAGIGHGGVKAKRYTNNSYISQIPTDSWFVMIWVENGIIGLIVNILIMISIITYSSYLILFKFKNKIIIGYSAALLSASVGIIVACYANELLGPPNGIITYAFLGFIISCKNYDKQLSQETSSLVHND